MSLTIPRAGVEAGRAANAAGMPMAPDPAAEAFAKLGDVMAERGAAIQRENDDMSLQRINLDMARDMGRVRQEIDQSNDPNVGQVWEARSAEIRQRYVDAIPELNAGLRERAALVFDDMNTRHSLAVGQRAIGLRSSYRAANFIEQSSTIAAEAANAPPETLQDMLAVGEQAISARLQAGDITPEQAATERVKFRTDVLMTRAKADVTRDPAAFLNGGSDQYAELGTAQAELRAAAEVELARRQEAEAKAQEVAVKEQRAAIDDALRQGIAVIKTGALWSGEADLNNPLVQASPLYPELMAAKALRDEKIFLGQKTPAELQALIDAEAVKPKGRAWEAERLKVLQDTLANTKTAWATNGVDAAKSAGLITDVLVFDPANPGAFAQGLAKRLAFDENMRPSYTKMGQAIYGVDEAAALKPFMAPEADAAPKLALISAFAAQDRPAAQIDAALAAAGGGDVEKRAMRLLKTTGDKALVEKVLLGQQQIAKGLVKMPSEADMSLIFADVTGGIFEDNPALAAQLRDTAKAAYAADAIKSNPDDGAGQWGISFAKNTDAQTLYASAVRDITGVAIDSNGQPNIGGLQEVNGGKVILPQGVHREEVATAIDNITYQLRGYQWSSTAENWVNPEIGMADTSYLTAGDAAAAGYVDAIKSDLKPAVDPMRAFQAASYGGPSVPLLGADPVRKLQDVQFRRVGESDVYEMVLMIEGRAKVIPIEGDAQGRAYRFRMTDLIKGAQR